MDSVGNVNINPQISYKATELGVLAAPDSVGNATLYSGSQTEKLYQQLNTDIYDKQSKVSPGKSYSTPKGLYYAGGLGILVFFWQVCKNALKK